MPKPVQVRLGDGSLATCRVLETLGYQPSVGAHARLVLDPSGRQFMAVGSRGSWREWVLRDKIRPGGPVTGQSE